MRGGGPAGRALPAAPFVSPRRFVSPGGGARETNFLTRSALLPRPWGSSLPHPLRHSRNPPARPGGRCPWGSLLGAPKKVSFGQPGERLLGRFAGGEKDAPALKSALFSGISPCAGERLSHLEGHPSSRWHVLAVASPCQDVPPRTSRICARPAPCPAVMAAAPGRAGKRKGPKPGVRGCRAGARQRGLGPGPLVLKQARSPALGERFF